MPAVCEQILVRVEYQQRTRHQAADPPIDIQHKIEEAFKRAAEIDADNYTASPAAVDNEQRSPAAAMAFGLAMVASITVRPQPFDLLL